uniref:Aminotransferase class I/classII domain-containing protein n=1 Tax=Meloidogyne incognita TaxID=6306 RepID=A0A914N3V6_MELIC
MIGPFVFSGSLCGIRFKTGYFRVRDDSFVFSGLCEGDSRPGTSGSAGGLFVFFGFLCDIRFKTATLICAVFVIINEESIAEEDLAFLWPGFPLYARLCRPNGIESRQYRLEMDDKGLIDLAHLESLIDSQIRAIIVNNPLNPTGVTFESCGSEIVVGSEVRTKSTPICSFGSIAVNFSQGIPMIGVLYEDAWTLNETCRFRVFGGHFSTWVQALNYKCYII